MPNVDAGSAENSTVAAIRAALEISSNGSGVNVVPVPLPVGSFLVTRAVCWRSAAAAVPEPVMMSSMISQVSPVPSARSETAVLIVAAVVKLSNVQPYLPIRVSSS